MGPPPLGAVDCQVNTVTTQTRARNKHQELLPHIKDSVMGKMKFNNRRHGDVFFIAAWRPFQNRACCGRWGANPRHTSEAEQLGFSGEVEEVGANNE